MSGEERPGAKRRARAVGVSKIVDRGKPEQSGRVLICKANS